MIYSFWDIECEILKLVITSHLTTLKPAKSGFWKNKDVYILLMCTSHDVFFLWYGVRLTEFFVIIAIFCPITPLTTWKTKILEKMKKKSWRSYSFTQVYQKWRTYDVWSWDTRQNRQSFFVIFAILPSWQPGKSKFWKNGKKAWIYYHFTKVYHEWRSYDV